MFAFGFFVFVAGAALAASQRDIDTCFKSSGDEAIAACTRVIQDRGERASNRASAYTNRGVEYRTKGDLDRAIADHSEAIRLNPKLSNAYYNRGNAYRNKGEFRKPGDRARAIADYRKALELGDEDGRERLREMGATP
jgi:tetratricopeptide (TPR) repeat protein